MEAQRLGLEVNASDLNPVPILINKALLELPAKFSALPPVNLHARSEFGGSRGWRGTQGLASDIEAYGKWMRNEAERRIGYLYPTVKLPSSSGGDDAVVIAWIWARTIASPNPAARGEHVPLVRSFWLSTKQGKKAWVDPVVDKSTMTYRFEVRSTAGTPPVGTIGRTGGICVLTGSPMSLDYIRNEGQAGRMGARLMAIVAEGNSGRIYVSPNEEHVKAAESAVPENVPETDLPIAALGFRVQNYGMTKHRHLFTKRQLVALTTFCDLVSEAKDRVVKDALDSGLGASQAKEYADAVATYLGLCAAKASVFLTTLARWRSGEGKSAPAFGRQAIAMVWDFTEINPFAGAGGDFDGIIDGAKRVCLGLPAVKSSVVTQQNAENLSANLAVFSTDPPYYDNVPYADLSDYFYIWIRRCLGDIYPDLLGTVLVPKAEELIADPFRHGSRDKARDFFERGMGNVFARIREFSDPRYPATIYYAFKQEETGDDSPEDDDPTSSAVNSRASTGWETFLQGLVDAGWQIDGTWPMRTEGATRMRGLSSNALASSIILVCRPRSDEAPIASRREFVASMKKELPTALRALQSGNIAPVDLAQAAIGPGMAVFTRYAKVLEANGSQMPVREGLVLINQILADVLAEQEGAFDVSTRWALAWFEQYGVADGPYGVAETLSKAKNTSVAGMAEDGIVSSSAGKVRLLRRDELPANWDPRTDKRLTDWETAQHLILALDTSGEAAAAALLAKLPGEKTEACRDLAYQLYALCEKKKWAQDAIAYNGLIIAWPELVKLAQAQPTPADDSDASEPELGLN